MRHTLLLSYFIDQETDAERLRTLNSWYNQSREFRPRQPGVEFLHLKFVVFSLKRKFLWLKNPSNKTSRSWLASSNQFPTNLWYLVFNFLITDKIA